MAARWTDPVRWRFSGDRHKAESLRGEALKLLGTLQERMQAYGIDHLTQRTTLPDLSRVEVTISYGRANAHVYVPDKGVKDRCALCTDDTVSRMYISGYYSDRVDTYKYEEDDEGDWVESHLSNRGYPTVNNHAIARFGGTYYLAVPVFEDNDPTGDTQIVNADFESKYFYTDPSGEEKYTAGVAADGVGTIYVAIGAVGEGTGQIHVLDSGWGKTDEWEIPDVAQVHSISADEEVVAVYAVDTTTWNNDVVQVFNTDGTVRATDAKYDDYGLRQCCVKDGYVYVLGDNGLNQSVTQYDYDLNEIRVIQLPAAVPGTSFFTGMCVSNRFMYLANYDGSVQGLRRTVFINDACEVVQDEFDSEFTQLTAPKETFGGTEHLAVDCEET